MKNIYRIFIPCIAGWTILGFNRGINEYTYKQTKYKHNIFLYHKKYLHGLLGSFFYINPILWLPLALKELYRIEVNIRDLQDEKNTSYYNEIL